MSSLCYSNAGPPRFTAFLREYSDTSRPYKETSDYDLTKIIAIKRKEAQERLRRSGATWVRIRQIVENAAKDKKCSVERYFQDILEIAQIVSPEPNTREEVGALLFNTMYKKKVLLNSDRIKLRQFLGEVKPLIIDKAYKAVQNIVILIGEEDIADMIDSLQEREQELNFGANIKVGPLAVSSDLPVFKLLDLWNISDPVMTVNYDDYHSEPVITDVPKHVVEKVEAYDVFWIKVLLSKFYSNEKIATDLAKAVHSLLMSSKSNEELQNELFDFLGFERFEVIQTLLENRNKILSTTTYQDQKLAEIIVSMGNRHSSESLQSQVVVMSETERQILKQARKEEKKVMKSVQKITSGDSHDIFDPEDLRIKRERALLEAAQTPLFRMRSLPSVAQPKFPYVFDNFSKAKQSPGFIAGTKMSLPIGFKRSSDEKCEEVTIPTSDPPPTDVGSDFIMTDDLDEVGQAVFAGCKSLNRIQTVVYPMAYHSNENLLICAPTGAGKTNIALLTVVHQIRQHMESDVIQKDKFKIVYIAPMKALASEMTANFSKKLGPLGLTVRELTGDMHLTKAEILATSMIITTPEKWDVITRKPGDTQLSQLVKLLIIDEVHLLHGDRGPVLEALVARTLRMVESQQTMIRIVGLSATLPNYIDVATFLRVNPYKGLFYFDGRFRPVPLGMTFIGIKALGHLQQMEDMDSVTFDKILHFVRRGHQVIIFVHARNGTLRTAENMIKIAQDRGMSSEFKFPNLSDMERARKDLEKCRNKKLAELFDYGFSVHHAGLLRGDRNVVERLFSKGMFKVLVSTATLAWGVNLPAHAVIIKGTQIYDSKHGAFIDLGILDVVQIFGRAGRPQFDKKGHGVIITAHDKLSHYLSLLTNQYPIESSFLNYLADNLNAEVYGIHYKEVQLDGTLEIFRRELITKAALALDKAHMIRFQDKIGSLHITDLGRIASQYYIKYDTVEIFNEFLKQMMTEADILEMISTSSEFQQLKVRDEDMNELDELHHQCEVIAKGGAENVHGKVNILLQGYISRIRIDGFSLLSDMNYITENSVRIARALFEIVLHKNWPILSGRLLTMAKMLEQQMWFFENPLKQFSKLPFEILEKIEEKRLTVEKIREMDAKEVGYMIRHARMGKEVKAAAMQFPLLQLEAVIQPITRTVLRIKLFIAADFKWNDSVHGKQETYWIWVEDPETNHMYHHEQFTLTKKQVVHGEEQNLVFTIPIFEPLPPQYYVKAVSDRWLECESSCVISFQHLILPETHPPHTDLLDLDPLPVTALADGKLQNLYKFTHFNPIQTQLFHCLYHTDYNVLLGSPTGSGKTIAAELAMFRVFREYKDSKIVYIAPLKALVRERVDDWKIRLEKTVGKIVVELTGDVSPDVRAIQAAHVIVTTPEKWDGISRSWQTRNYVKKVGLIVIDEIHLLGEDRGPVLEVIVSRTGFISNHTKQKLRIIGLSTALANAKDLANWLGIGEVGLFNFRPSVRPVPLEVHIQGFPGKHYCPRMTTMNKPTFHAIKQHSPDKPVLVFVSSRRQTRLTALDLMGFVVTESDPKQWLKMPEHEMDQLLSTIKDENLRLCLSFGVGIHHAGLVEKDRKIVEELFINMKVQILITTATLAWGVNFPAHLVVVKGTEYYDGKTRRYVDFPITDVLQMMGRAGRPQYDDHGVAVILVHDQKKDFYKKFLYEPFPVESSLLEVLPDHLNAEIVAGTITTKQDALDYLTWTYFFRRLVQNPTYYGLELTEEDNKDNATNTYLSKIIDHSLTELGAAYCIDITEDNRTIESTPIGKIASFYYVSHKTVHFFQEKMNATTRLEDLLDILAQAHEYSELPVRHNEDNLNAELAQSCPVEVNTYMFDSPHTKAFLLLQAHFSRLKLPCVDYLTDTKLVLDQSIRILQSMLDISACSGWLTISLKIQTIMQMVTQARWHTDCSLLILPYVTSNMLYCFRHNSHSITCLPELVDIVGNHYETLAHMLRNELEENLIESIFKAVQHFPLLQVDILIQGWWDESLSEHRWHVEPSEEDNTENHIKLHANQEYSLVVHLRRINKVRDTRVMAPKFPKAKDEGWFLVLGDHFSDELIALKRVPVVRSSSSQILSFRTPDIIGTSSLTLYIMSDGYLGLDQQYKIFLEIVTCSRECPVDEVCSDPVSVINEQDLNSPAEEEDFPELMDTIENTNKNKKTNKKNKL